MPFSSSTRETISIRKEFAAYPLLLIQLLFDPLYPRTNRNQFILQTSNFYVKKSHENFEIAFISILFLGFPPFYHFQY